MVAESTYISGRSPDFRPRGVGVDLTLSRFIMCRQCGFTAPLERFEETTGLDKESVRAALAVTETTPLFQKLDRAIAVERNWSNDPVMIAHLCLAAKWLADDTGEPAVIRKRLVDAIDSHKVALDSGKLGSREKGLVTYLVGELYRQADDRTQAIEWLSKAEKLVDRRMAHMVQQQMFLARYDAVPPAELVQTLSSADDGAKVAAIGFLRDSRDPAVIEFLKDVCLDGPESLSEPAIEALLGDEPRAHHLPIFLEGLRSKHFRTVQGCARGVEALRAPEAAPIIVEVLKDPVPSTDARLWAALAAVATEQQLDYLASQVDRGAGFDEVFKALLNTRSAKAVPYVLQMLKRERMLSSYCDAVSLENAAAMGPALLDQLPDLSDAAEDDSLAVFKVRVLGAMDSDAVEDRLLAALNRGGDVGMYAALALAGRGNEAAKPVLLANLERVRYLDETSITLLYRLLKPEDYDLLDRRMAEARARDKARAEERAALYKETLEDPGAAEHEKRRAERDLERVSWNEDLFMSAWLPLLGATGNPKGRPLYLGCLESDHAYLRVKAVGALAGVYDDAVGDALADRLNREQTSVADAIIAAMGKAGDTRQVDMLLALASEPTLVSTKLAWIDAMMRLAPEQALPVIRGWSDSPDPELQQACERAISAAG